MWDHMLKRVLHFYTQYFVAWIVLGAVLAYFRPDPFLLLEPHMKLFFGLTMFGIEIGMQNAGPGTVLALMHVGQQAAIPTAIFVFVCLVSASVLAELWSREHTRGDAVGPPAEAATS